MLSTQQLLGSHYDRWIYRIWFLNTEFNVIEWSVLQTQFLNFQREHNSKRHMHPSVHCSTVYDSQDMEATQMIINRGMNKDVVHISNGILLDHKKERNWVICRDVHGPRDGHTGWSKSEREKQISYINIHMWDLGRFYRWSYLQSRNKDIYVVIKHMDTKGERRWMNQEIGIGIHTLLCIKYINFKHTV